MCDFGCILHIPYSLTDIFPGARTLVCLACLSKAYSTGVRAVNGTRIRPLTANASTFQCRFPPLRAYRAHFIARSCMRNAAPSLSSRTPAAAFLVPLESDVARGGGMGASPSLAADGLATG